MISIKGFPLIKEKEFNEMLSHDSSFSGCFFLKPIFQFLPDYSDLCEEEREKYIFKKIKKGVYLIGLELISDKWVNKGFCAMIFENFGLVLKQANPIVKKNDIYHEQSLVYLSFEHIGLAVYSLDISVSQNGL